MNRQLVNASFARMGLGFSSSEMNVETAASPDLTAEVPGASISKNTQEVKETEDADVAVVTVTGRHENFPVPQVRSRDVGLSRGRGVVYVQLVVATLIIVFAAPIETRMTLGRLVTGPLIVMPVLSSEQESER